MNLTYVIDSAGRVTRDVVEADSMSAGGVCLPTGALRSVRRKVPRGLPKWRDATDQDVSLVVQLLRAEAFAVAATVVRKAQPAWESFWRNAEAVNARTAALSGRTMSFVKAATQVRY